MVCSGSASSYPGGPHVRSRPWDHAPPPGPTSCHPPDHSPGRSPVDLHPRPGHHAEADPQPDHCLTHFQTHCPNDCLNHCLVDRRNQDHDGPRRARGVRKRSADEGRHREGGGQAGHQTRGLAPFVLSAGCSSSSVQFADVPNLTANTKGPRPVVPGRGSFIMYVRRRPTLPHRHQCSTIGAEGLSFRVRNGAGRFPFAMTAVTLGR